MSQYWNRTHQPCTGPVAAWVTLALLEQSLQNRETNIFILTLSKLMHIIDARCFRGSELALTF